MTDDFHMVMQFIYDKKYVTDPNKRIKKESFENIILIGIFPFPR